MAERETGVADGAADPLADVRAQAVALAQGDAELQMMIERLLLASEHWGHLSDERGAVSGAVGVVLAALDAERAENEQIIEDLGRDVDAAVVANEQLRERAERAEAAIARARAVPERLDHHIKCLRVQLPDAECGCGTDDYNDALAAVVAALETETP